jgi:flagellar biosynthesis protein FlhF
MKEALNKVRADLGPEAVILDARQCQASGLARILAMFGISQKPMFEVMAAIDRDGHAWGREFSSVLESAREAGAPTSEPGFGREPGFAGTSLQSEGNGESKGHGSRGLEEPNLRLQVVAEENGQETAVASGSDEESIAWAESAKGRTRSGVDATLNVIARESAVRARVHSLPKDMVEIYQFLVDEDVSEKTAFRLANAVASKYECAPGGSDAVLEWAFDEIASLVDVAGPIEIVRGRRKVVGLIGPTGVGKTTSIAKIAAGFALVEKARTALITADTYRIAAIEQIKTYAEIIGLPWEVVYSPRDMETALAKHSDAELVLIDTAGRSPNSPTRMYELKSTSSKTGGMGTTIIKRMSKTMTAIRMSPRFMYWRNSVRPPPRASPILSTPSAQKIIVSSATTGKQRPIPPQRLGKAQEESPGQSRLT